MQRSKLLPTNLHSVKRVSKNEQPVNVQFTNAASVCTEQLKVAQRGVDGDRHYGDRPRTATGCSVALEPRRQLGLKTRLAWFDKVWYDSV